MLCFDILNNKWRLIFAQKKWLAAQQSSALASLGEVEHSECSTWAYLDFAIGVFPWTRMSWLVLNRISSLMRTPEHNPGIVISFSEFCQMTIQSQTTLAAPSTPNRYGIQCFLLIGNTSWAPMSLSRKTSYCTRLVVCRVMDIMGAPRKISNWALVKACVQIWNSSGI